MLIRKIGYTYLTRQLMQLWKPKISIVFIDLGSKFCLVKFSNDGDYDIVLFDGPWMVSDHILAVRQWQLNFFSEEFIIDRAIIWIRIPGLPIEYYDKLFLNKIGNRIGRTVHIDANTKGGRRGDLTCLSTEIDLTNPLISKFRFCWRIWRLEYKGLHLVCFKCKKYEHQNKDCPTNWEGEPKASMEELHSGN